MEEISLLKFKNIAIESDHRNSEFTIVTHYTWYHGDDFHICSIAKTWFSIDFTCKRFPEGIATTVMAGNTSYELKKQKNIGGMYNPIEKAGYN